MIIFEWNGMRWSNHKQCYNAFETFEQISNLCPGTDMRTGQEKRRETIAA